MKLDAIFFLGLFGCIAVGIVVIGFVEVQNKKLQQLELQLKLEKNSCEIKNE